MENDQQKFYEPRISYNMYLYKKRMQSGLSRREFRKAFNLFPLHYYLLECGYLKPSRKTRTIFSAYFGEEFEDYCQGIASYPEDIPPKPRLKITVWAFDLIGSLYIRIALCLMAALFAGLFAYGLMEYHTYQNTRNIDCPEDLNRLKFAVRTNGFMTISPNVSLTRLEVFNLEGSEKMASIKVDTDDEFPYNIDFVLHYWSDTGRLSYSVSLDEYKPGIISVGYSHYVTNTSYTGKIDLSGEQPVLTGLFQQKDPVDDEDVYALISAAMLEKADTFLPEMDSLIEKAMGEKISFLTLGKQAYEASSKYTFNFIRILVFMVLGGVLTLLCLFVFIFGILYGTKNGVVREPMASTNMISIPHHKQPRADIRFAPFLPETLLSVAGSSILLLSSTRIITYAYVFLGKGNLDLNTAGVLNTQYMNYFYLGMFLLYFLDFDIYLDDMRVIGRVFLYLFLYLGLYGLEYGLLDYLETSTSPLYHLASSLTPPNMFGTICLYFVIMLFLFFTPKFIKKHRGLILYRCCSLIPVAIIFTSHIVSKVSDLLIMKEQTLAVRLLFNEERIAFSLLCVSYLFMVYFLRLFFERRYGTEDALKIFNGNRYIWLKNILTVALIVVIVVLNQLLGRSSKAFDLGWGHSTDLLLLIPLILFYHPHKGARNKLLDAIDMGYYIFALMYGYISALLMVVVEGGLL